MFEISLNELKPAKRRTLISVDITEPQGQAIITPRATVIRQAPFRDAVPWILVALFDTGSNDNESAGLETKMGCEPDSEGGSVDG